MSGVAKEAETESGSGTSLHSPPEPAGDPVLGAQTELIAVCGFPGVGKSTISERLTDQLDATRLRTDAIRKKLFDEPTYSSQESRTVYRTAFDRARSLLRNGTPVVFDASFANERHRERAMEVAAECKVPFRLLKVDCDEHEVVRRIKKRDDISDADVEVYYEVREQFDALERDHYRIDNSGTWEQTRRQVDALLP